MRAEEVPEIAPDGADFVPVLGADVVALGAGEPGHVPGEQRDGVDEVAVGDVVLGCQGGERLVEMEDSLARRFGRRGLLLIGGEAGVFVGGERSGDHSMRVTRGGKRDFRGELEGQVVRGEVEEMRDAAERDSHECRRGVCIFISTWVRCLASGFTVQLSQIHNGDVSQVK